MPMLPTTENAIRGLKPEEGRAQTIYRDSVESGLGLRVGARTKTWVVDYRDLTRKRCLAPLGAFPAMGLKEARVAAKALVGGVALGIDLVQERDDRAEAEIAAAKAPTVRELWDKYERQHVSTLRLTSQRSIRNACRDMRIVLGDRKAAEIKPADVRVVLDRFRARGSERSVFHARASMSGFFKWLIEQEVVQFNPVAAIRAPKRNKGQRVLSDAELQDFLLLINADDFPATARDVLLFALLTGRRIGEIVGLEFDRVDFKRLEMTIFPEDDKEATERVYPLSKAAMGIVEARRRGSGGNHRYVFQGVRLDKAPTRAIASLPLDALMRSGKWKHRRFSIHDLRRTFRTLLARLEVRFEVAELAIGHSLQGVHAIYDRHTYIPQIRQAVETLSAHVAALQPPSSCEDSAND